MNTMGSSVATYWFVVFFITSSVHGFAFNVTVKTTSTTSNSRPTYENDEMGKPEKSSGYKLMIFLSTSLSVMVIIWIITLGICRRKLRSQSRNCHCKHSENEGFQLPSLPSTAAPQLPKRHIPPHPSPSLDTISASLTDTQPPTTAPSNGGQETNGKTVDMMYEYEQPRIDDFYLEITS